MKVRRIVTGAAVATTLALTLAPATALAGPQADPGTPGSANCVGQSNAFLAQRFNEQGEPGLGNVAKVTGFSVTEIQAIVQEFCNSQP